MKKLAPDPKNSSSSVVIWSFEGVGASLPDGKYALSVMDGFRLGLGCGMPRGGLHAG